MDHVSVAVRAAQTPMSVDWASVYEAHGQELAGYLVKLIGDREVARDLTQDAFVGALRARHALREPAAAVGWLYRIATNLAISYARRRRLLAFVPFATTLERPERDDDPALRDDDAQVRAALRSISTAHAATLLLFYDAGFERAEIARMLGVSEEAVKSRLARGRRDFIAAYRRMERGLAR